jgi:hypothetical protein
MAEHLMNASVTIEACRAVLSQEGQHKAAGALRGLELMDQPTARMAFNLLSSTPVYGAIASAAKQEALNALQSAATQPVGEA